MRNIRITTLFCTLLLLLMVVSPVFTPSTAWQTGMPASTSSNESLIVRVFEDESVYSGEPDTNYSANTHSGGLWVGFDGMGYARAWLKYDLSSIPKEIGIVSVSVNLYCLDEYLSPTDLPVGVYYSWMNDWSETSITWNTQPGHEPIPYNTISSPASPDMFVPGHWYSWDVTNPFYAAISNDKMLTLMLKQIDEMATNTTWTYYVEKDYDVFLASYLSVEYTTPETTGLAVDGHSDVPLIDYIQDSTPELSWTMSDSGTGEFQRDYALEMNSNEYFNGTVLWHENHTSMVTVHDASDNLNTRPFGTANETRYQMKFDTSLLSDSGVIDMLHFETTAETGTIAFHDFVVLLVCTSTAGSLTTDFQVNYGSVVPITVLNRSSYSAQITDHHFSIDVENTFFLNSRLNLIIELRFTNNTGTLTTTPVTYDIGGSVAYQFGLGAYTSTTAGFTYNRAHSLTLELMSTTVFESSSTIGNYYPFGVNNGYPGVFQLKYNKSMIHDTGVIDRVFFTVEGSSDVVYEGLQVYLVESPRLGALSHTNFAENYGGVTPTKVLDKALYQVRNLGRVLVIDVDNVFYYHGDHDLLIEIRWANKLSGVCTAFRTLDVGAYRAYNLTYGSNYAENDTRAYDMFLSMVYDANVVEYAGAPLLNATTYYWRVKTCDSTGIWSDWTSSSFKYEKLSSTPAFEGPVVSPSPAYVGSPVTFSINVTYFLGINSVWIEISGTNHSMSAAADTYSYAWTPTSAGNVTYTIYMVSSIGTWSTVSGVVVVLQSGLVFDPTTLLIIAAVGLVVVIALVVVLKRRGKK